MASELRQAGVDLGNLVMLLGDNLYSTPTVFLRELAQNAHDAITRRQIEAGPGETPVILVSSGKDSHGQTVLVFEDNGSGLTADEIHSDLATIGRSATNRLRKQNLDGGDGRAKLIGAFGLGFMSAYVVSDLVRFITTSHQRPGETWAFSSRGGNSYSVDRWPAARPIGTRLELTLKAEYKRFLAHPALFEALTTYCALLAHPIFVSAAEPHNQVNGRPPPWRRDQAGMPWVRWHGDALDWLGQQQDAYPPLAVFPVGGEAGDTARGILWLNDFQSFANNDNRAVRVYIRDMLVAKNERELLPHWAGFVSAAIEADGLTPTASRESLRRDEPYGAVRDQLERDLVAGLASLASAGPATAQEALWKRVQARHNQALLIACGSQDELMAGLGAGMELETTAGRLAAERLSQTGDGQVYISSGRSGVDGLFAKVRGYAVVDGRVAGQRLFLDRFLAKTPDRLVLLGQTDHDRLFPRAPASPAVADFVRREIARPGDEVRFAKFEPCSLPLVRIWNEHARTRKRLDEDEAGRRVTLGALRLAKGVLEKEGGGVESYLYVNLASPIWTMIADAPDIRGAAGAELLKSLLVLLDEGAGPERETALGEALSGFGKGLEAFVTAS